MLTVISPWGVASVVLGSLLWVVIGTRLMRPTPARFRAVQPVAGAALASAVLGSALNDSDVLVWAAVTVTFALSALAVRLDLPGPLDADVGRVTGLALDRTCSL